jgi:hypothetical protein
MRPERVVGEELHHVARREELVAHRQLAAVARRLALLAHLAALVLAVEELVDPADGLVLAPHAGELGGVQDLEELLEGRALRPQHARRIAPVEEDLHLGRQLVEERLDVEPVALRSSGRSGRPGAMPQNSR